MQFRATLPQQTGEQVLEHDHQTKQSIKLEYHFPLFGIRTVWQHECQGRHTRLQMIS